MRLFVYAAFVVLSVVVVVSVCVASLCERNNNASRRIASLALSSVQRENDTRAKEECVVVVNLSCPAVCVCVLGVCETEAEREGGRE